MAKYVKPHGWPRHVKVKKLSDGDVAYYWEPPPGAKKDGCPITSEPLGRNCGEAITRAEMLNQLLDAWRDGQNCDQSRVRGSLGWLVSEYRKHRTFLELSQRTQKDYLIAFDLICKIKPKGTKKYSEVGEFPVSAITYAAADKIYETICKKPGGGKRVTTANKAMRAIRRAWNVVHRLYPTLVPADNPFMKMDLRSSGGKTEAATREELMQFVRAADELELGIIGTAAMITFEWLLREADIINHLLWSDYRPLGKEQFVHLRHGKTKEMIWLPLEDEFGLLFPALTQRIDELPRYALQIIVRKNKKSGEKDLYVPFKEDWFRHRVAKIRDHAGLRKQITFTSFRHGGLTELGNAGLADQSMMALSAHKTRHMLTVYSKRTEQQRAQAARTRLNWWCSGNKNGSKWE